MPRYSPKPAPIVSNRELQLVVRWLEDELRELANTVEVPEIEILRLTTLNTAPSKVENGDVARADGTNWNPGGGEGVYERKAGAWSKL